MSFISYASRILTTIIVLGFTTPMAMAQAQRALSESELVALFREEAVSLKASAAQREQSSLNRSLGLEQYSPTAYGSAQYGDSDEKSLSPFQPTLAPTINVMAGIRKRYAHGITGSAEAFSYEASTSDRSLDRAAQFGARATVSMDLWRNYLGKLDEMTLQSAQIQEERVKLETEIQERSGELALRKAFWSLVAIDESLKVNAELIRSAERQLNEAQKRLRDGISDRGETARYEAQVESRRATEISLQIQRKMIESGIKKQIASLHGTTIRIKGINLDTEESKFKICSSQIIAQASAPMEYAASQDLLKKLAEEYEVKQKQASLHSSPDLSLQVSLQRSGVDQGSDRALDDFATKGKQGFTIGLNVTVPLDEQSDFSERKLISTQKLAFEAQTQQLRHELTVTHEDTRQALQLLGLALERQARESRFLTINLEQSRQKFNQGRIPVSLLIQEQDGLFASRLTEIDIKRQIIHAMYDYFQIFTKHPCPMNQIRSVPS